MYSKIILISNIYATICLPVSDASALHNLKEDSIQCSKSISFCFYAMREPNKKKKIRLIMSSIFYSKI
jgi:hypothetical protein